MTSGEMVGPQLPQWWHHFPTFIHHEWTAELEDATGWRATQVVSQALGHDERLARPVLMKGWVAAFQRLTRPLLIRVESKVGHARGKGGCHHQGVSESDTRSTHLTHQNPRRPGATSRSGKP